MYNIFRLILCHGQPNIENSTIVALYFLMNLFDLNPYSIMWITLKAIAKGTKLIRRLFQQISSLFNISSLLVNNLWYTDFILTCIYIFLNCQTTIWYPLERLVSIIVNSHQMIFRGIICKLTRFRVKIISICPFLSVEFLFVYSDSRKMTKICSF